MVRHVYDRGVRQVRGFQEVWDSVEPFVDVRRFTVCPEGIWNQSVTRENAADVS